MSPLALNEKSEQITLSEITEETEVLNADDQNLTTDEVRLLELKFKNHYRLFPFHIKQVVSRQFFSSNFHMYIKIYIKNKEIHVFLI